MKFRNTIVLLIVLVALGVYVIFFEMPKSPQASEETATPTALPAMLTFDPTAARLVRIADLNSDQVTELVFGDDGLWHIQQPVQEEADQPQVTRFIETLSDLSPQRVLTGTVGVPADYGLDPASKQVEVALQDGSQYVLRLGARAPAGSGYYAQVSGDERIYLIALYVASDIDRYLSNPPIKPTPTATLPPTQTPTITPTAASE